MPGLRCRLGLKMEMTPPATSRHMNPPLWLLPSGPDQVHGLSLREDQWSHHNSLNLRSAQYKQGAGVLQTQNGAEPLDITKQKQ